MRVAYLPTLELVYEDSSGDTASITMSLKQGTTVVDAYAAANDLIAVVSPLTQASLVRTRLKYRFWEETRVDGGLGSLVKRQAVFFFSTTLSDGLSMANIPSIKDSLFVMEGCGAGAIIDDTNPLVQSFVEALLIGDVTDPFANAVVDFLIAYRQSRV